MQLLVYSKNNETRNNKSHCVSVSSDAISSITAIFALRYVHSRARLSMWRNRHTNSRAQLCSSSTDVVWKKTFDCWGVEFQKEFFRDEPGQRGETTADLPKK